MAYTHSDLHKHTHIYEAENMGRMRLREKLGVCVCVWRGEEGEGALSAIWSYDTKVDVSPS